MELPVGHVGGPPLYGKMMRSISRGHSIGNTIRMLKLPLIFTSAELYAGAIAQFYFLTAALETALDKHAEYPMIARVRGLGLNLTPGYAADLKELCGKDWRSRAEQMQTAATKAYVEIVREASPVELTAAAFILYGALVVGGGKMTQAKVRKIFPSCTHALFDVAPYMKEARAQFKATFTAIGKEFPDEFETLETQAARFMGLNNTVVLSIRCLGRRTSAALGAATLAAAATVLAWAVRRWRTAE